MAAEADIPVIKAIADAAWPVAYGEILSPQQIDYMINLFYGTDALKEQMNNGHQFILSVENGIALGFAGFEHNHPEPLKTKLHKLYVHPDHQHKKIGGCLLKDVTGRAKDAGSDTLLLNVNRSNKALGFYTSHNFTIVSEVNVDIGSGYFMNDYVMATTL